MSDILEKTKDELNNCKKCPLCLKRNNIVFSDGSDKAKIMFIGEAPGENEDKTGLPFVGRAGKLLREFLTIAGFKEDEIYITNTVKCRPEGNRKPTHEEKKACQAVLNLQIKEVNPEIIVLVGATALESFIKDKKLTISRVRGQFFEIENKKFMPIFHPSYLLRNHSTDLNSPRGLTLSDLKKVHKLFFEH